MPPISLRTPTSLPYPRPQTLTNTHHAQHPELQQQQYLQDPKQAKAWLQQQQRMPEEHRTAVRLLELALQFCIYSEAANLRHTPHLLFLLYYLMRGSREFCEVGSKGGRAEGAEGKEEV